MICWSVTIDLNFTTICPSICFPESDGLGTRLSTFCVLCGGAIASSFCGEGDGGREARVKPMKSMKIIPKIPNSLIFVGKIFHLFFILFLD